MTSHQMIELSARQASEQIWQSLQRTHLALCSSNLEAALDELVSALGLALQLGPAATEMVLSEAVATARELVRQRDANALSALGPALVGLSHQVREAGVLPKTAVMDAWAVVVSGLGALLGELGLILSIARDHRSGMMANASIRAASLDNATGGLFELGDWLDEIRSDSLTT